MLRKLAAGDSPRNGPNSVRNWNHVVVATNHFLLHKAGGEVLPEKKPHFNWHTMVMVANETAADRRCGEVVEFSGFLPPGIANDNLLLSGAIPNLARVGWGITLEEIPYEADPLHVGRCLVVGACQAYVKIVDEAHEYANREAGECVLKSCNFGPVKLLHKPTGGTPPEERLCAVQITGHSFGYARAKLDGACFGSNPTPIKNFTLLSGDGDASITTAINPHFYFGRDDAEVSLIKDESTGGWDIVAIDVYNVPVVVDIRLDGDELQYRRVMTYVQMATDFEHDDWEVWHTTEPECPEE